MYNPAQIILQSYMPTHLSVGMYFKTEKSFVQFGNETPIQQIWTLDEMPDDMDAFIAEHGAPVKPVIGMILDENPDTEVAIIAKESDLGWIEYDGHLLPLELRDINYILSEFQGHIGLYLNDDEDEQPYKEEGKVVICPIDYLYDDQEYD